MRIFFRVRFFCEFNPFANIKGRGHLRFYSNSHGNIYTSEKIFQPRLVDKFQPRLVDIFQPRLVDIFQPLLVDIFQPRLVDIFLPRLKCFHPSENMSTHFKIKNNNYVGHRIHVIHVGG